MIYSDLYTQKKGKIPTVIGVLVIVFFISFFINLTSQRAVPSKASLSNLKRTEIVNLSPIQTTIFWQTEEKEVGWIVYGDKEDKLINIALDDRDVSEKKDSYLNHYVTIRNLKPDQKYFYAIVSSNMKIIRPDGKYFSFKTPLTVSTLTKLSPANGKVLQQNLSPLSNAIVLITVNEKTFPVSTLTKGSGEWLIPLNSFYDIDSIQEKSFSGIEHAKVEILSEDGQISTITNTLEGLQNNSDTTIIGKNYNYIEGNNVLSATTENLNIRNNQVIQVIYPKEGALIPGRKPLIKGVSLPKSKISILIESNKSYSANITADSSGAWSYLIPENLELGDHKITIKTYDEKGKEITITRNFKIVANEGIEGKVLGTASGEPTITLAPTSTPVPTKVTYISPTIISSPTSSPPVSGIFNLLPIVSGISLIIVGGGIILAF